MDIDEYLKKKKELEKKKELLEARSELDKKKVYPKKEIEIKRKTEITHIPPERPTGGHYHDPGYRHPKDNIQWVFLGFAFFVALIIVGIYVISSFMNPKVSDDSDNIDNLQKKLDDLEKQLKDKEEAPIKDEPELNETEEENESVYTGPGPEFNIFILDDHNDVQGIGIFDDNGKIGGKIIDIWLESGESGIYKYRLGIKNEENTKIQCKVDETIRIDGEFDGEYENTDYNLDLHVLEINIGEEEIINDAVITTGEVKGEYEARCYFCEDKDCDLVYTEAETKHKAIFRVRMHPTGFNSNETNSTN
ncbi:MAG: hypothetical protein Q8Q42_03075 [Nanoarchaeota archaeon]|nr:hypothetical protein [Nanoarchaeota archaeon]